MRRCDLVILTLFVLSAASGGVSVAQSVEDLFLGLAADEVAGLDSSERAALLKQGVFHPADNSVMERIVFERTRPMQCEAAVLQVEMKFETGQRGMVRWQVA